MITSPSTMTWNGDVIMVIYEDDRFTYRILYNRGGGGGGGFKLQVFLPLPVFSDLVLDFSCYHCKLKMTLPHL
jgi:hypothetical protein